MKVLLLAPLPPPVGGISRWTQIVLGTVCSDCEFQHINIAPKYKGKSTTVKRVLFGIGSLLRTVRLERKAIKKNVDILHLTSSGSFALLRDYFSLKYAYKHGVPTVYHLHYGRIPTIAENEGIEWKLLAKVFDYCSAIVAIDKYTKSALCNKGYKEKTHYCPNPIDVFGAQSNYGSETKEKKIVFAGHVYKTKGVGELTEAWRNISKKYPDYSLEIIGSLSEKSFVESLPEDESVRFLGEKTHSETMLLLSKATMLVLPSYSEGFPNVVLEAMALKVPIIATNVGAIPEMLSDGGGILIEPRSVEQLQAAICSVLEKPNLGLEMAEKSYEKVKKLYDAKAAFNNYLKLWEMLKA